MSDGVLRLKMSVSSVKRHADSAGEITSEEISIAAVYGEAGSANAQWSKYTPTGSLTFNVTNKAAFGKLLPGQFLFVDLIPTTKDAA